VAIEPDAAQAVVLQQVLEKRIPGRLVVVKSTEAALKALVDTIPDLVLVSPLLPPRTEDQFVAHLRALGVDASHLQMLSIPRFGDKQGSAERKRTFGSLSLKKFSGTGSTCDPVAFADEVAAYLTQVTEVRNEGRAIASAFGSTDGRGAASEESEPLPGVRIEHIERLLERLQADNAPPLQAIEKFAEEPAAPVQPFTRELEPERSSAPISERDVMPMQTAPDMHAGTTTRDVGSGRAPRFLTLDDQISSPLRALLDEADGCLRMNFMTGGGACAGRALDLLLSEQGIVTGDRAHQIQELGKKQPAVADSFLRVLAQVISDSGGTWDAARLTLAIALLKAIAYEIYVLGPERTERATYVIGLLERFNVASKGGGSAA